MARKRIKQEVCQNCNTTFIQHENFCRNCGQENHSPNQPVKHLFYELFEAITHLDSKVFLTFKNLFLKPGLVTQDFIGNRRARYIPPIRIYIFTSAVFFFILQKSVDWNDPEVADKPSVELKMNSKSLDASTIELDSIVDNEMIDASAAADSVRFSFIIKLNTTKSDLKSMIKFNPNQLDSALIAFGNKPDFVKRLMFKQFIKTFASNEDFESNLIHKFLKTVAISIFLLMPIYALLMKLLYFRFKRNYYEYLIFSIHYHIVYFSVLSVAFLLSYYDDSNIVLMLGVVGMYVYLFFALRRIFEQSKVKTVIKASILSFLYSFLLILTGIVSLIIGWLTI